MKLNRKADREPIRFETHLAGATFPNLDGTSRQDALNRVHRATMPIVLELVREPDNPCDENAIAVFLPGGETQIGYIPAPRAQALAFEMDREEPLVKIRAEITSISPPNRNGNRSATLSIIVEDL
jgi:hypothetical protein